MDVLHLAAHIRRKLLEDNHPGTTLLLLYMTCSLLGPSATFLTALERSKSGNMIPVPIVFKHRGKI